MNNNEIFFYDAFISYRHVHPDKAIAEKLHGLLENFKTPKTLVQKGLPKKLTRVFRDEEELPTSNSLSDSIKEALERSRYLIVICSEETPKSKYVGQEIEIFKAMGRSDKIITVLLGKKAEECFPKELLSTRHVQMIDGEEMTMDVEPLAANVYDNRLTGMFRKLKRREKYRLLAPILGCTFDELFRRSRKRQAKKMVSYSLLTVVIVAGLFGILIINHNKRINDAQRSLENEINNNLYVIDILASNVDVIFESNQYLNVADSEQNTTVMNKDANDVFRYSHMANTVQGQIDSLNELFREEQLTDKNIKVSEESNGIFNNNDSIDNFYKALDMVEDKGEDIVYNCIQLKTAYETENDEIAGLYFKSTEIETELYELYCENAVIAGMIAMYSADMSVDTINYYIDVLNMVLTYNQIEGCEQLFEWSEAVFGDIDKVLLKKEEVTIQIDSFDIKAAQEQEMSEILTVTKHDSYEDARAKILVSAQVGRLDDALAGLDYFEEHFVTDGIPEDQVFVDTARIFMPLYINKEIDSEGGICVLMVQEGSMAEEIGLTVGDVLIRYGGKPAFDPDELVQDIATLQDEKDEVEIRYVHFDKDGSYEIVTKKILTGKLGALLCGV